MAFCSNCGSQIPDGANNCPNCGSPVGGQPQVYIQQVPKQSSISVEILSRALKVVMTKPIKLWGLSLLSGVLSIVAYLLGGPVLAIGLVITLVLDLGMSWVYLDGYRGQDVSVKQLFEGFDNTKRSFMGMGWYNLLIILWSLIPVVGLVFAIIKGYEYQLVPYVIRENKEISAVDAAKESSKRTNGYKGKMFVTDLIICAALFVVSLVLTLLAKIPYVGILFAIIDAIFIILLCLFGPLYFGLIKAAWYEEICNKQK